MANSKAEYEVNVLAHIAKHRANGETEAVKKHLAVPAHKVIVDTAALAKVSATVKAKVETKVETTEVQTRTTEVQKKG